MSELIHGAAMTKALPVATQRWLELEQVVNDRRTNPTYVTPLIGSQNVVRPAYRPESRHTWALDAILVPTRHARPYGNYRKLLAEKLCFHLPPDKDVVFVHPQSMKGYRRYIAKYGLVTTPIVATPTSSYRSLLAWNPASPRSPVILKVSLFVVIGTVFRDVKEQELARSVLFTRVLDDIDPKARAAHGFEFFGDVGGSALDDVGKAWILRTLPASVTSARGKTMVPLFALCSARPGERAPLLVSAIGESGCSAEEFVCEKIIDPYVRAFSYLLLVEGLGIEAHSQNVLCEMTDSLEMTGKIAFRDFGGWGASVNVAMRAARGKSLPLPPPADWGGFRRPLARLANAHLASKRATESVVRFGMHQVVWELYQGLAPHFARLRLMPLRAHFLQRWKRACMELLHVNPLIASGCAGIPLNEAIDAFLLNHEWSGQRPRSPTGRLLTLAGRRTSSFRPELQISTNWGRLLVERGRSIRLDPAPVRFARTAR